MINTSPINTLPINAGEIPATAAAGLLTLNGLDIATGDIKATNISDEAIVNVSSYDIPQNHGRGFLSNFKRGRTISMTVYIRGDDESDFQTNLDAFRKACFTNNAILDWKRDGVVRRIKVNCTSNPQIFNHYNIDFLRVDVQFTSLEPFWYKLDNQSTSVFGATATFQEEITNIGTAQSDVVAYLLFGSISGTNQVKMKIGDFEVQLDQALSSNDIVKIDGETKRVYVNDVEVDYSGIFPYMVAGTNFFTFTINGTFTCDVLVLNKKNYV